MRRLLVLAVTAIAPSVLCAQGNSVPDLPAHGLATPQLTRSPGAPLQVVSTRATMTDFLDTVELQNVSGKEIASFELGITLAAPEACSVGALDITQIALPSDRAAVAPGSSVTTHSYRVSPEEFALFDKAHGGHDVLSVLVVKNVTFSDGSMWSIADASPAFEQQQLQKQRDFRCARRVQSADISEGAAR